MKYVDKLKNQDLKQQLLQNSFTGISNQSPMESIGNSDLGNILKSLNQKNTQQSTQQQANPQIQDLKYQILSLLPQMMEHQKSCDSGNPSCKMNQLLWQYFIQKEISDSIGIDQKQFLDTNDQQPFNITNDLISGTKTDARPSFDGDSKGEGKTIQGDQDLTQNPQANQIKIDSKEDNLDEKEEAPANNEEGDKEEGNDADGKGYVMRITKCPHHTRKHYAKNMCSSCYRKYGRNEYAVNCPHTDRLLYSKGMCQTCYLSDYHQKRTKVKREKKQEEKQR